MAAPPLVALKVVDGAYPLRGRLRVAPAPDSPDRVAEGIPAPGTVWVDAALLESLDLQVGDALLLGDAQLSIAAVLTVEPDRGAGFMNFAPRVMLGRPTWPPRHWCTGQPPDLPHGRGRYRRAGKGVYRWADARIKQTGAQACAACGWNPCWGRPEMTQTLERAEKFLSLVALLAALLSAVAVALAARAFARATWMIAPCCACWVCASAALPPATPWSLPWLVAASLLGVLLGFAVHFVFVRLLAGLVETDLPAPGLLPLGWGWAWA